MPDLSKNQIDKLGERLRAGEPTESDLQLLDAYRNSFRQSYERVVRVVEKASGVTPLGRSAKTDLSIIAKLRRERFRLSRIQDIAGCRVVVEDIAAQNTVVEKLMSLFSPAERLVDRREDPSHGYRAVHVVVNHIGKLIEVQVRTKLQHAWALLSERLAAEGDPELKYGGGTQWKREFLDRLTTAASKLERNELFFTQMRTRVREWEAHGTTLSPAQIKSVKEWQAEEIANREMKARMLASIEEMLSKP